MERKFEFEIIFLVIVNIKEEALNLCSYVGLRMPWEKAKSNFFVQVIRD